MIQRISQADGPAGTQLPQERGEPDSSRRCLARPTAWPLSVTPAAPTPRPPPGSEVRRGSCSGAEAGTGVGAARPTGPTGQGCGLVTGVSYAQEVLALGQGPGT